MNVVTPPILSKYTLRIISECMGYIASLVTGISFKQAKTQTDETDNHKIKKKQDMSRVAVK